MKLSIEHLSFHYPNQTDLLLDGVTFHVKTGSAVSILGPSGCGKSTLFYLLGGLQSPNQGEIKLDGKSITRRGEVGYMPQASSLFPWMTVKENILLGQKLGRGNHSFPLYDWLNRAGLIETENLYPHQLSGGMQQRVSFLRALAGGQDLLCLDEPFASLDALTRTKMQQWLASLMDSKRTFLLITHHLEEALLLTDQLFLFTKRLQGEPIIIDNPFPREERFNRRKTPAFWEMIQELETRLHH